MAKTKKERPEVSPKAVGIVMGVLLVIGGGNWLLEQISGDERSSSDDAAEVSTEGEGVVATDTEWFESNVKYQVLEGIENRGAEAPVILDWSCTWASPTEATCAGNGYDNAPALSSCGYSLLPCGPFDIEASASCSDPKGTDCDIGMELVARA